MIKGVCHAAITVRNLDESVKFYSEVLGFIPVRTFARQDGARVVDLTMDDQQIGEIQLIHYPALDRDEKRKRREPGLEHFALLVEDMDAVYEQLLAKGVKTFVGQPTPGGPDRPRTARFFDPNGVLVELITWANRGTERVAVPSA